MNISRNKRNSIIQTYYRKKSKEKSNKENLRSFPIVIIIEKLNNRVVLILF